MKIRVYEADSLGEAYRQLQEEADALGYTATILSTRNIPAGGLWWLLGRQKVRITAAMTVKRKSVSVKKVRPSRKKTPEIRQRPRAAGARQKTRRAVLHQAAAPLPADRLTVFLKDQEVDDELARELAGAVARKADRRRGGSATELSSALEDHLTRLITVAGPIRLEERHLKIVAFVGPTGVGKTTTIAKLAADFTFTQQKKVALITLDTYRIAAVEQLRTYARIMKVPLEVAHTPQELKLAVNLHADKDVIFIDTAGRSPNDDLYLSELKNFLGAIEPVETHLVVSAATRARELGKIIEKYGRLSIDRVAITKVDEVDRHGLIVNLKDRVEIPISYITVGQNVPRDIEVADARKLARLVTGASPAAVAAGR